MQTGLLTVKAPPVPPDWVMVVLSTTELTAIIFTITDFTGLEKLKAINPLQLPPSHGLTVPKGLALQGAGPPMYPEEVVPLKVQVIPETGAHTKVKAEDVGPFPGPGFATVGAIKF